MINKIQTKLYFLSLSTFVVLIDQFTKYLIFHNYKELVNTNFILFKLDFVKNFGAAFNLFLYNLGKYSLGKVGYHFLMLFPLLFFIKPIERLKHNK